MRCRQHRDDRGVMLVEAIVALGLLGLAMAALSTLMTQHLRQAGKNTAFMTAISLGEQELEDLRSLDYNSIASRTNTPTTDGVTTYTVASTVVADSPTANMKSITTKVTWTGLNGPQTYSLYTIYTQLQH